MANSQFNSPATLLLVGRRSPAGYETSSWAEPIRLAP
jgi:hypothetical protein